MKNRVQIDLQKTESYSIALSEKLCTDFYQGSVVVITGTQILKFTQIEQLNLFVIKNLFEKWKEEAAKIRSPYFDYEAEEVKEAMQFFLNKLSKNISIRKEFFKPLLKKSIMDTWLYLLNPYEYIVTDCLSKPIVALSDLREKERYFKVNKFLIQGLIKKLQLQNKPGVSLDEARIAFDEVYKNFEMSLDDIGKYSDAFSQLLKIKTDDLLKTSAIVETENVLSHKEKTDIFISNNANKELTTEEPKNILTEKTINDLFAKNQQLTINDMLQKSKEPNILTQHKKSKIQDLKKAVPLNLKYIFINELFNSSAEDYQMAISQVERCNDFASAKNIIDQVYAKKYNWNFDSSEVIEFMELVERRFY